MARHRRRRRKSSSSVWAWIAIVVLVLFIGAAALSMVYLKLRAGNEAELGENLCPADGPKSVTAFLLDATDPVSEVTKADLQNQFQKIVGQVPKGGLIEVFALTEKEGALTKTFSGCNPGDEASADPWTSNPKKIRDRWKTAFGDPLNSIIPNSNTGSTSSQSPIMAGIQRIVIEGFSKPDLDGLPKQLYVASDMLEHTPTYSMYRSGVGYETFTKSAARDLYRTPLAGIEVKILAFQRPGAPSADDIAEFWVSWIRSNEGELLGYERLAGMK